MSKLLKLPEYTDAPPGFYYILTKAQLYLKLGPKKYRKIDYFKLPAEATEEDELESIETGMNQLLDGCGYSAAKPLRLSVRGFYCLVEVLHFSVVSQSALFASGGILDCMECMHSVNGSAIALYNFVPEVADSHPA